MSVTAPPLEVEALLAEMARLEELRLTLALGLIEREVGIAVEVDPATERSDGPPEMPIERRSSPGEGARRSPVPGQLLRSAIGVCQLVGVAAVVFTLWSLVGTGVLERMHQQRLRTELTHQQPGAPPTPGRPVATIDINRLGIHQVIAEGVTASVLRGGPGRVPGSADPGAPGTVTIAGHRTTMGGPFRRIGGLRVGDDIFVTRQGLAVHYHVITPPQRDQLSDGAARLLLVTADPPYQARTTLSVWAQADSSRQPGGPAPRVIRWAGSGADAGLASGLAALLLAAGVRWMWRPRRRGWLTVMGAAAGLAMVLVLSALVLGAGSPLL